LPPNNQHKSQFSIIGAQLMESNHANQNKLGIANFAALKTSIANGEEQSVKELLANQPMQELETSYLIDLAKLNNNRKILRLLEDIPIKK
jgi:hypothetical protein